MNKFQTSLAGGLFAIFLLSSFSSISAETQTEMTPIDAAIGLEATTLTLNVPENNNIPWAFVEGKISNPVAEYPVIIQIFDNDLSNDNNVGAVHFAQTEVDSDGNYEYKFRVANTSNGQTVNIFEGDYTVKIFKVVYLNPGLSAL